MSAALLEFFAAGHPAPQGSKRGFFNAKLGRVQMVESSKAVAPWREAVKWAAMEAVRLHTAGHSFPLAFPVSVTVVFALARPASHLLSSGRLAKGRPLFPTSKPDIDKLQRSTLDALVAKGGAGVLKDDSVVTHVNPTKVYSRDVEGAWILIRPHVSLDVDAWEMLRRAGMELVPGDSLDVRRLAGGGGAP